MLGLLLPWHPRPCCGDCVVVLEVLVVPVTRSDLCVDGRVLCDKADGRLIVFSLWSPGPTHPQTFLNTQWVFPLGLPWFRVFV